MIRERLSNVPHRRSLNVFLIPELRDNTSFGRKTFRVYTAATQSVTVENYQLPSIFFIKYVVSRVTFHRNTY